MVVLSTMEPVNGTNTSLVAKGELAHLLVVLMKIRDNKYPFFFLTNRQQGILLCPLLRENEIFYFSMIKRKGNQIFYFQPPGAKTVLQLTKRS